MERWQASDLDGKAPQGVARMLLFFSRMISQLAYTSTAPVEF